MSSGEKRSNELLDRLILDIKAFVLLQGTDEELRAKVSRRIASSQDQSVVRFVESLQSGAPQSDLRQLAVAVGEMVMASILVLVGVVTIVPSAAGSDSVSALVHYFEQLGDLAGGAQQASPAVAFIEFALGALLLLSAFYSLRQAGLHLRRAGLGLKPRG